jgi:hypothetical protein
MKTTKQTTPPTGKDGRGDMPEVSQTDSSDLVVITNHDNCTLFRWRCSLCGGQTERQRHLYTLPGNDYEVVCDDCANQPESIPDRIRKRAQSLREHAADLEAWAKLRYATDHRLREQNSDRLMIENRVQQ